MDIVAKYFYAAYGKYITRFRALPLDIDMLRPVERRTLLSVHEIANNKFVKSAKIVGHAIGTYHPHSDASLYGTLVRYVKTGMIDGQGGFYSYGVTENPPAAMRYTEVRMNKKIEALISLVQYAPWEVLEFEKEPLYFPSPIPIGLIGNTINHGIAFHKTTYPSYTMKDLFRRLLWMLGKTKTEPKIRPFIEGCKVLDSSEYMKLLKQGIGTIKVQSNYKVKSKQLHIYGCPVSWNKLIKYSEKSKSQITDLSSNETHVVLDKTSKEAIEAITNNVKLNILAVDFKGMVRNVSIDEVIKLSYEKFKLALLKKLNNDFNATLQKISELQIIAKLKPYVKSCNTITEISVKSKVPEEDAKRVLTKYSASKLVTVNTDIGSLNKKVKDLNQKISHIGTYASDMVLELSKI